MFAFFLSRPAEGAVVLGTSCYEISRGVLLVVHYQGLPPTACTVTGIRLSDLACRKQLCQCILRCMSMHLVSQPTRLSMHLTLKIYSSSFSRFQVMTLTHHHTKVKLIFKHHIAVPQKDLNRQGPQNRDKCSRHR